MENKGTWKARIKREGPWAAAGYALQWLISQWWAWVTGFPSVGALIGLWTSTPLDVKFTLYVVLAVAGFLGWQQFFGKEATFKKSAEPTPAEEPAVEFSLPGSWAEAGFRHRSLGVDGQHELLAEQVYLRIKAERKMQNVRIRIAARQGRPDAWDVLGEIEVLPGVVTTGWEQSFQIMQRTYWNVPATFTDPNTGHQPSRAIRVEKDVSFFPENPQRFLGVIGHLYCFRVTVHHDEGPDEAEFAIEVTKRRDGPQSIFKVLKNIKTVTR